MTLDLFPDAEPSITLDFLKSKKLDPRITFGRASSASPDSSAMVNGEIMFFDPNVPRLSSNGLLIEAQSTNILLQSNDFTTYWTQYNVTIDPNVETAPDGTTTASKMQWSSSSNRNCVYASPTTNVAQTHTCSFYAKAAEWNYAAVAMQPPGGGQPRYWITVDLTTGAVKEYDSGTTAPTQTDYDVTPLPNGWWRVSATANVNNAGKTQIQMEVGMSPDDTFGGAVSGTPDNSGIYIWGAQEEDFNYPTSLIPTSGSTVTRAADVCTITGTDFSSWYNQQNGTWIGAINTTVPTTARLLEVGVPNYSISIRPGPTSTSIARNASGAASVATTYPAKFGATNNVTQIRLWVNGTAGTAVTTGDQLTNSTKFSIGQTVSDTSQVNAPIANISFYPTVLSDDSLQALTT